MIPKHVTKSGNVGIGFRPNDEAEKNHSLWEKRKKWPLNNAKRSSSTTIVTFRPDTFISSARLGKNRTGEIGAKKEGRKGGVFNLAEETATYFSAFYSNRP